MGNYFVTLNFTYCSIWTSEIFFLFREMLSLDRKISLCRKWHFRGRLVLSFFVGIFKITLQLMRFQSQKLYQVKRLLSDVRKIKKGSWKSWCFKQLFLPSVVWDSYIFLTSENNKKVSTCNIFQKSSAYAITREKKSSSLLLFDWPTVYKVIAHCLYSSCQSVSVFSSSV